MRSGEEGCEFALGSRRVLVAPVAPLAPFRSGLSSIFGQDYRLYLVGVIAYRV
jgi:hypothetical protein